MIDKIGQHNEMHCGMTKEMVGEVFNAAILKADILHTSSRMYALLLQTPSTSLQTLSTALFLIHTL